MMKTQRNHSLKRLNAFHVDVKAKYFVKVVDTKDIVEVVKSDEFKDVKKIIIGEGSGTFFTKDFEGLVIYNCIKGVEVIKKKERSIKVKVGSGEIWDDFVKWSVDQGYSGIENMSFIPGTVGAAPVQNIAAYGQSQADPFLSLQAVELKTGRVRKMDKKDCKFSYRSSIFKNELRDNYFITYVTYKLVKENDLDTTYHSRYESLESELKRFAEKPYSLKDVRIAVGKIRSRKFPDWKKHGNTGSYFLNPFINKSKLNEIKEKYPDVQYYPTEKMLYPDLKDKKLKHSETVKLAAGWLLEEIGWKGKKIGNVGTSPNQSLVIVNYGGATADEILEFAEKMKEDFKDHFGIELKPEVNII